jgi:hypothetical protein
VALHMGHGGKLVKTGSPNVDVHVVDWAYRRKSRLAEATNSSTGGYAKWKGTVKEGQGTATLQWDSSATPETLGIIEGAELTFQFHKGSSGHYATVAVVIEECGYNNDNTQGLVMFDISFKLNGAITETTG